jgi:hypothetical protein
MRGSLAGGVLPSISSSSVWHTPQRVTRISASPGPGWSTSRRVNSSGLLFVRISPSELSRMAFMSLKK